jgi:hypothetical protein
VLPVLFDLLKSNVSGAAASEEAAKALSVLLAADSPPFASQQAALDANVPSLLQRIRDRDGAASSAAAACVALLALLQSRTVEIARGKEIARMVAERKAAEANAKADQLLEEEEASAKVKAASKAADAEKQRRLKQAKAERIAKAAAEEKAAQAAKEAAAAAAKRAADEEQAAKERARAERASADAREQELAERAARKARSQDSQLAQQHLIAAQLAQSAQPSSAAATPPPLPEKSLQLDQALPSSAALRPYRPPGLGLHSLQSETSGRPAPAGVQLGSGLSNAAGEYMCFLNSLVQSLYHVVAFRRHLAASDLPPPPPGAPPKVVASTELVRSLKGLCGALSRGATLLKEAAPSSEGNGPVAPHALRNALAAMPGAEAKLNQMADAAEVLDKMYEAFAVVSDAQRTGVALEDTPVARMFGIRVSEAVRCRCGVTSHAVGAYNLYFHVANASALRALAAEDGGAPFEARLQQLLRQDTKGCDRDLDGCGESQPVTYSLERLPQVFTLSLTWASASAPEEEVAATMAALSPMLRLSRIYGDSRVAGLLAEDAVFELRSLVCYYGSHYECFCRPQDGAGPWTRFDDSNVNIVGDGGWEALKRNAAKGHLQGTVLFYERQELMF